MRWEVVKRSNQRARRIADRHYNRQSPGKPQFVPPGRCLVLMTPEEDALWVTSWPFAEFVQHEWAGAWICSLFRNEGDRLSSTLITEAVAATRWRFGEIPEKGFVTFVNEDEVTSDNPGYCYIKAGWERVGYTQRRGYHALQLAPEDHPEPEPPISAQRELRLEAMS